MPKYMVMGRISEYREKGETLDYNEISISEMKKTGQFIEEYSFWYLAKPKAKNDFTTDHIILREKNNEKSNEKCFELYELIEKFSKAEYTCRRNSVTMQSIPKYIHYHIAKFKDIDKEIIEITKKNNLLSNKS